MANSVDSPAPRRPSLIDHLALAISAISSPFVILPIFIAILLRGSTVRLEFNLLWLAIAVFGLVGVPLGYVVWGLRRGTITDLHVSILQQRRGLFLTAIAGAAITALLLQLVHAPIEMQLGAVAVALNGALFGLISLRWKISMHPSTLGASATLCGMLVDLRWFLVFAAVPAVMWARVHRQRHDWAQTLAATALASGLTAGMVQAYWMLADLLAS